MRVAIFGLGYVGSVSAACLADEGHEIVGVDTDERKTRAIAGGAAPQAEPGLEKLIRDAVSRGALTVTSSAGPAVRGTDLALVCVGTPSGEGGALSLDALERVSREIGASLAGRSGPYGVVVRSTSLPGTLARVAGWLAESSGRLQGDAFDVASNPEFLREGTAVADFARPPFTVVGTASDRLAGLLRDLYAGVEAPFLAVEPGTAEAVKYACNSFHAAKVTFANEIGRVCRALGVDGREVMRVFCEDRVLNLSPYYLKPGFSYGGSCLPKDVRALASAARHLDVETPLLASLERSNRVPVDEAVRAVVERGRPRTAFLGLSFKADTDDMRESPFVEVIERLHGKGLDLAVFDPDVRWDDVFGSNRAFVEKELPHLAGMLVTGLDAMGPRDVVVVGKAVPGLDDWLRALPAHALVLDLVGAVRDPASLECEVRGIAW